MIEVTIDKEEFIKTLSAAGHSNPDSGKVSIICSAVSMLLQTYYCSLVQINGLSVELTDNDDVFLIEIKKTGSVCNDFLKGIENYLYTGLFLLKENYPENIKIQYKGE